MHEFDSLEPAIDPNNRISFLLDWELTLKCNLDCSYCLTGLWGGHDNTTAHPSKQDCLSSIDFMLRYVDIYMKYKPSGIRNAVINIYGGESLHHPDIVDILIAVREKHREFQDRWSLTITTTTNAIISTGKLSKILPLIDEFTVSYHSENSEKQKNLFKDNLLAIAAAGKRQKCVVLMHQQENLFADSIAMIHWLERHGIKTLPRQLDGTGGTEPNVGRRYKPQQVKWFGQLYQQKNFKTTVQMPDQEADVSLTDLGRACCGGRQVCLDQQYRSRSFFVNNKFENWFCSVNYFFLYIKQVTGDIFVNKDCKMNFQNEVGPIGHLAHATLLLQELENSLQTGDLPVIQCKKSQCLCGLCAPKARHSDVYHKIMDKYLL